MSSVVTYLDNKSSKMSTSLTPNFSKSSVNEVQGVSTLTLGPDRLRFDLEDTVNSIRRKKNKEK